MSFSTRNGTRGARSPGRLMRLANKVMIKRVRKDGTAVGLHALVLHTLGRKSGAERITPLGWFPDAQHGWLIVASAAGAARNPDWYYNIAANPDKVSIEVDGRTIAVTAAELHGDEREQAWQQIVASAPRFGQYQNKTDREMPIIRLRPRQ
ncbi:nitroreductase family deazaflavin-dependent oxidoreductase [Skermania sp. ID1734]|uniref:nitroreductase family deazaflavin-dependent oxidoreductase n=1 Tax=Skermania sp. ID1734 TaxID=2597516 RepID=UPI00117BF191|nr:nitroreductase family deazaflavin-dependent oxidoreductase [Skermania sp. ID1734]TSD95133.1 nitroreductase family deazaflavin-dependent oxidoreductase [Skermania sp. ID1734]